MRRFALGTSLCQFSLLVCSIFTLAKCYSQEFDLKAKGLIQDPLKRILDQEAKGIVSNRAFELTQWVNLDAQKAKSKGVVSSPETMRWHSGELLVGKQWQPVDKLQAATIDERCARYEKERGGQVLTLDQHQKLAKWCRQNSLRDQARAHWFAVLDINPHDLDAKKGLEYVEMGSRLLSPEEVASLEQKNKAEFEALKRWIPRISDLVKGIQSTDSKRRLKAIQEIREINDPTVVSAIGFAINHVDTNTLMHLLRVVGRFRMPEACYLLASVAITDPSTETGTIAMQMLRDYPLEFYVPDLLDLMTSEYQLKQRASFSANGSFILHLVQSRELRRKYDVTQFNRLMAGSEIANPRFSGSEVIFATNGSIPSIINQSSSIRNPVANSIIGSEGKRHVEQSESNIENLNHAIRALQGRIAEVLRGVTQQKIGDDAKDWWDWWDRHEELYSSQEKMIDYSFYHDVSVAYIESKSAYSTQDLSNNPQVNELRIRRFRMSCLVAGTPIQTQSGLRPVESIRVGDLVVAQNIQSGEIQFRPVLRTTVRPPAKTYNIALVNGEKIQATLGHRWWVIGQGWVKTKDLKEGMSMRTDSGYATIESLKDADAAVTYNLLVDQDHTYFVGQSRVLSFDASEAIPTFYKVPGLAPSPLRSE